MQIQPNVSLDGLSSFHSLGKAKGLFEVSSINDILFLYEEGIFSKKFYFLGKGCNTLFNGDFDGILIKNRIMGIACLEENEESILLKVGGGEDWVEFVKYCVERGYAGIENLSEIPGTVGAAPVQNIGAYGSEVAQVIYEVHGIDIVSGEQKVFSQEDCAFAYRDSVFKNTLKNKFIITHIIFRLPKYTEDYNLQLSYADIQHYIDEHMLDKEQLSIKDLSQVITAIRQAKLPNLQDWGTAGSFFKNPIVSVDVYENLLEHFPSLVHYAISDTLVKIPAAQLIELVGMKGVMENGVGTYHRHALILVSDRAVSGDKIVAFARKIQEKVNNTFKIFLEPEVNII